MVVACNPIKTLLFQVLGAAIAESFVGASLSVINWLRTWSVPTSRILVVNCTDMLILDESMEGRKQNVMEEHIAKLAGPDRNMEAAKRYRRRSSGMTAT
ncbi:MAG: hypothetical protein OXI38_00665 [Bacteroidota bacterium]|nr:hypothetical protein [Bacteroidota bacterium]